MKKIFLAIAVLFTVMFNMMFTSCGPKYVEECYEIKICNGEIECKQIPIEISIENTVENYMTHYDTCHVNYLLNCYFNPKVDENKDPLFKELSIKCQREAAKNLLGEQVYIAYLKVDKNSNIDLNTNKFIIDSFKGYHRELYSNGNNEFNLYTIYDGADIVFQLELQEIEQMFRY